MVVRQGAEREEGKFGVCRQHYWRNPWTGAQSIGTSVVDTIMYLMNPGRSAAR